MPRTLVAIGTQCWRIRLLQRLTCVRLRQSLQQDGALLEAAHFPAPSSYTGVKGTAASEEVEVVRVGRNTGKMVYEEARKDEGRVREG